MARKAKPKPKRAAKVYSLRVNAGRFEYLLGDKWRPLSPKALAKATGGAGGALRWWLTRHVPSLVCVGQDENGYYQLARTACG